MPRHEKVALGLSALLATGMAIYSVRDKPADKFPVPPVDDVPNMLEPTTRPHADRVDVASRIKRENARSPTTKPERG